MSTRMASPTVELLLLGELVSITFVPAVAKVFTEGDGEGEEEESSRIFLKCRLLDLSASCFLRSSPLYGIHWW